MSASTASTVVVPSTFTSSMASTSATSAPSPTASDVEPDDDVSMQATADTSALTSAEQAAAIINQNQIALDPRLAVFTLNGTTEPRVVRLFPTTCSCLAKADHMQAAKMAVGYMTEARKLTMMMMMMILMMTMH